MLNFSHSSTHTYATEGKYFSAPATTSAIRDGGSRCLDLFATPLHGNRSQRNVSLIWRLCATRDSGMRSKRNIKLAINNCHVINSASKFIARCTHCTKMLINNQQKNILSRTRLIWNLKMIVTSSLAQPFSGLYLIGTTGQRRRKGRDVAAQKNNLKRKESRNAMMMRCNVWHRLARTREWEDLWTPDLIAAASWMDVCLRTGEDKTHCAANEPISQCSTWAANHFAKSWHDNF